MPSLTETACVMQDTARQLTELLAKKDELENKIVDLEASERAQEYNSRRLVDMIKSLQADLDGTTAELTKARLQIDELKASISAEKHDCDEAISANEELCAVHDNLRRQISEQQTYITSLSDTIAPLKEKNKQLTEEVTTYRRFGFAGMRERIADLERQLADFDKLKQENEELTFTNIHLTKQLAIAETDLEDALNVTRTGHDQIAALQKENERLTAEITVSRSYNVPQLQATIEQLKKDKEAIVMIADGRARSYDSLLATYTKLYQDHNVFAAEAAAEKGALKAQIASQTKRIDEQHAALCQRDAIIADLQLSLSARDQTIADHIAAHKRAMDNVAALSDEARNKGQLIDHLRKEVKQLEQLAECYKCSASATVLEAMQQKYQALLNTHQLLEEKCDSLQASLNIRLKQLDEINQISGDHGA